MASQKNFARIKSSQVKKLRAQAEKTRRRAYAPYSGFKVGAAVLTDNGKIFSGCNVENASYGGTICAERTAILKAISEGGKVPLRAVHVVSSGREAWPPCGLCLQVMAEFCEPQTLVTISGQKSGEKMFRFADLLPESFDVSYLKSER